MYLWYLRVLDHNSEHLVMKDPFFRRQYSLDYFLFQALQDGQIVDLCKTTTEVVDPIEVRNHFHVLAFNSLFDTGGMLESKLIHDLVLTEQSLFE